MKRLSVLKGMLVSYILITLVPVCAFLYAATSTVSAVYEARILDARTTSLQHASGLLDQRLRECKSLANQITLSPSISRQQLESAYSASMAVSELKGMNQGNEFIGEIGVWYTGEKYLYLGQGAVEPTIACEKIFMLDDGATETFTRILDEPGGARLALLKDDDSARLFYFEPLPANYNYSYGKAIFVFDNAAISALLERDASSRDSQWVWIDSEGGVLWPNPTPAAALAAAQGARTGRATLDGKRFRVLSADSHVEMGLRLFLVLDEATLRPTPEGFGGLLAVTGMVIVSCLSLTTWFTSRYWRSFRELCNIIYPSVSSDTHWETIQAAVRATMLRSEEMSRELSQSNRERRAVLRENLLLRMIDGDASLTDETEVAFQAAGLAGLFVSGAMLAVRAPGGNAGLFQAVTRFLEERFPDSSGALEIGGADCVIAALFSHEDAVKWDDAVCRQAAPSLALACRESGILGALVGVGRAAPMASMRWSYLQACAALGTETHAEAGLSVFGTAPPADRAGFFQAFMDKGALLGVIARQGDEVLAIQTAAEMVNAAHAEGAAVYHYVCMHLIQLFGKYAQADSLLKQLDDCARVLVYASKDDFLPRLVDTLRGVCQENRERANALNNGYLKTVMDYIKARYSDADFSLDSVSGAFGSSPAYWSRFFKERLGKGFSDCVWEMRLSKAKELLCETDMSVNEIVERVGYCDARSFIRKFKASEGITPGMYRKGL